MIRIHIWSFDINTKLKPEKNSLPNHLKRLNDSKRGRDICSFRPAWSTVWRANILKLARDRIGWNGDGRVKKTHFVSQRPQQERYLHGEIKRGQKRGRSWVKGFPLMNSRFEKAARILPRPGGEGWCLVTKGPDWWHRRPLQALLVRKSKPGENTNEKLPKCRFESETSFQRLYSLISYPNS